MAGELGPAYRPRKSRWDHLPRGRDVTLAWDITLECAVHGRQHMLGFLGPELEQRSALASNLCPCLAAAILTAHKNALPFQGGGGVPD